MAAVASGLLLHQWPLRVSPMLDLWLCSILPAIAFHQLGPCSLLLSALSSTCLLPSSRSSRFEDVVVTSSIIEVKEVKPAREK